VSILHTQVLTISLQRRATPEVPAACQGRHNLTRRADILLYVEAEEQRANSPGSFQLKKMCNAVAGLPQESSENISTPVVADLIALRKDLRLALALPTT
jgi:hypothetical protein